ncbi:CvpA family protein [Candidatus Accumulibacter contiguus]|uniref:CvpA family protein n=1 Tax=Candidatus Accumulibacter contiguus TaxID=2954381 RepID=UPI00207BC327|nr:CvpA family protein [Candidatus Accumulibacter contiguus]
MTVFDYLVLLIVATSLLLGMWRGVVGEIIALVAWVLAFFAAKWWGTPLAHWFTAISDPTLRIVAGWVAVFMATLVIMALLRLTVRSLIKALGMTLSDRLLGLLFGVARGLAIVLLLVAVGGMTRCRKRSGGVRRISLPRSKRPFWPASPGCHPMWRNESGLGREKDYVRNSRGCRNYAGEPVAL